MSKEYKIEYWPKYKDQDKTLLGKDQTNLRRKAKKYIYKKEKTCNCCHNKQSIKEFYFKDKANGRRSNKCRDCVMKAVGVIEVGKHRFESKLFKKGFKRCPICKETKQIKSFSKSKSQVNNIACFCKACSFVNLKKFQIKQREEIGDFYVKQYALFNYKIHITDDEIPKYRSEIIENRKPKYFCDGKEFVTIADFARFIKKNYNLPITTTCSRIFDGKTEDECKLSEFETRSIARSKGAIVVKDTVTGKLFNFKNTRDKALLKMFSQSAITKSIKTGKPTRPTGLSKYKNPCIITRIKPPLLSPVSD